MSLAAALLLVAAAAPESGETPFSPDPRVFADAAACKAHLARLAVEAQAGDFDAVEGPYDLAEGDVRIHTVHAEGRGHRIAEHRCLGAKLSTRSWRHAMEEEEPEFSVESVARSAEWLKKDGAQ